MLLFLGLPSFPTLVENFISPTEKTAGGEAVDNDHGKQRSWAWLQKVDQTEDNTSQTYTAYAAPTPLAQPMIERICSGTY